MNVEVQLLNPEYCNGCPLIGEEFINMRYDYLPFCVMGYFGFLNTWKGIGSYIERPQECIDKHGE